MKTFWKENCIRILLLTLLSLLFILWGRAVIKEMRHTNKTENLGTVAARLACLKEYGWEASAASEIKETIAIPSFFGQNFDRYNQVQKACGFDLERYRGEKAQYYTYEALNFPYETKSPVYIHLLIVNDTLIGGDCSLEDADSFLLPLDKRFLP